MNIIAKILEILNAKMTEPHSFDWFHFMWVAIVIVSTILLCKFIKATEKNTFNLVLITTISALVLEMYKQINYTFTVENGAIVANYQWYAFPFQFCSMPMYIGLLYCLLYKTNVKCYLLAFLATFSLFGGLAVYAYPEQVFIDTIGINIQTMAYHGAMIVVGVWLLYTQYVELKSKTILKAMPVFAGCVLFAVILNEVMVASKIIGDETFNMFYISPHFDGTLPVYCEVQKVVPYPFDLIIYISVFSLAAYLMLLIAMFIKKLSLKKATPTKEVVTVK